MAFAKLFDAGFDASARESFERKPVRLVLAVVLGAIFALGLGWRPILVWLLLVIAVEGASLLLNKLRPYPEIARPSERLRHAMFMQTVGLLWMAPVAMLWLSGQPALQVAAAVQWMANLVYAQLYIGQSRTYTVLVVLPITSVALVLATIFSPFDGAGALTAMVVILLALLNAGLALGDSVMRHAQLRAATEKIEQERAAADAANSAKSAFLAMMSHELRTPISAILAGAEDLRRHAQGGDAAKLELITEAGAMMRTLLNDLLDQAKLEAGRMSVETLPFDLRRLVAHQMAFWRAEARRKGIKLKLEGASGMPRWVTGDPTRLRQILNNLLSNALKFTDAGAVTLRLERGRDGEIGFAVEDSGPGLTPEAAATLFTPFQQASVEVARTHGGTGLGLAISRDLARLMGGDISVRSEPGHGACFTLHVPLPPSEAPGEVEAPGDSVELPPLQVLFVDDHEINRRAVRLMLEGLDIRLTEASSGFEAIGLLEQRAFDLVLMDCHMPGMDGLQVTREVRRRPGPNQRTPIIAVTGSGEPEHVAACRAAGMNDHVLKPIQPGVLIAALAGALEPETPAEVAA